MTFKKDGIDGLSAGRINFYRVIAVIGAIYSIFLIYSGGLAYFMITTIFIGPGLALYILGEKQRNEPILPNVGDKIMAAVIVIFFFISVYCIATGIIVP